MKFKVNLVTLERQDTVYLIKLTLSALKTSMVATCKIFSKTYFYMLAI